ncbi:hypothetical protein HPB50_027459 [Hyalomma asiaticum]|uniref:Uncharacterized protein n=1 Tax=Hyalomma asiaticum TaxID=266040 RepID=A0ACB7TS82_HYAAI|nr:hypothetical protein HPB50_027459 [Hyalomma asiaticum]
MRRVQWFPMMKRKETGRRRGSQADFPSTSTVGSSVMEQSPSPKSLRRASSPPPASPQTTPPSPLRRTASSPSFCFLPCSLSELLLQESPQSTPSPLRRCETQAHVAGIRKQSVKTGDSVPQLPFQGYTSQDWDSDLWSRTTQTELAMENSTQTEPLAIFADGARLLDDDNRRSFRSKWSSRCHSTPFIVTVAALAAFVFVLILVATILGTTNSSAQMDGFDLPDFFENEPSVSIARGDVVHVTAPTTARAVTTAAVVTKRSAAEVSRRAKVRKATKTSRRLPTARVDERGATFGPRNLPTTSGKRRASTPPSTTDLRQGQQIVDRHDYATRRDHLQEVTGELDVPSLIVEKYDDNTISDQPAEYGSDGSFRRERRNYRSPSTTPGSDFVEEVV